MFQPAEEELKRFLCSQFYGTGTINAQRYISFCLFVCVAKKLESHNLKGWWFDSWVFQSTYQSIFGQHTEPQVDLELSEYESV